MTIPYHRFGSDHVVALIVTTFARPDANGFLILERSKVYGFVRKSLTVDEPKDLIYFINTDATSDLLVTVCQCQRQVPETLQRTTILYIKIRCVFRGLLERVAGVTLSKSHRRKLRSCDAFRQSK